MLKQLTFATAPETNTCLSVFGGLQFTVQQHSDISWTVNA